MGAGLAVQRGWPQGQENGPLSPHSTEGATSASGDENSPSQQRPDQADLLLYEEVAQTEGQPLEDAGQYASNYGSAASLTNLVPLDRRRSSVLFEESGEHPAASTATAAVPREWGSVPGQDEQLADRDGREMSVAYDLGASLSTEAEVRSSRGQELQERTLPSFPLRQQQVTRSIMLPARSPAPQAGEYFLTALPLCGMDAAAATEFFLGTTTHRCSPPPLSFCSLSRGVRMPDSLFPKCGVIRPCKD